MPHVCTLVWDPNGESCPWANDPFAVRRVQCISYREVSSKYWIKAAELGDAMQRRILHYRFCITGARFEKEEKKEKYHPEEVCRRYNITSCVQEVMNDRNDRAVKQFIIATNLGHDESIKRRRQLHDWRLNTSARKSLPRLLVNTKLQ